MKLAFAQMSMTDDMEQNYEKSLQLLEAAANEGAQLIIYPEVQLTKFFAQYEGLDKEPFAIEKDHRFVKGFCDACRKNKIYACPNFYIYDGGRYYDMNLLIDDLGNILGDQKMVHIAQAKQFYEQDYYTPSEEGFKVFDTALGKVGIVVCFDRHYPESIRTEALMGAELIIIPTANTKAEPSELFQWEVKIQAFQNSVNVAMCNRVGLEGDMDFSGESIAADFDGNTLMLAGGNEGLFYADIDMKGAAIRRALRPYTSLRRPELYNA